MPTAGVLAVAACAGILYATGAGAVHIAKKVGHITKTVVVRVVKGRPHKPTQK